MFGQLFAPLAMRIAAGIALLFFVGFSVQTVRIEGFNVWPVKIEGFKEEVKTLRHDLRAIKAAQIAAKERAEAERLRIEAEYREQAEKIDAEYQDKLADANARANRYARLMRVQDPRSLSSGASQGTKGDAAESADRPGEVTFVAVSREDFDILNENTIRLQQAHEWALSLDKISE